ncbi:MAG: RIP metalloprotease RseP [Aerococcaceae bacterium]|nr:RIP metalloprotease RseP [Aerococcaceae bacterium]
MQTIIVFLLVFSIIVVIHEWGHFYFAKKAGILVREFALGMGPKLFSKEGKDGVVYTVRMLPLGGYVRLAGLGEDEDAVKAGMTVGLRFNQEGEIDRIDTSESSDMDLMPVLVHALDLTKEMVMHVVPVGQTEQVTYSVNRKARIIEPDGTSILVAPEEVTYNAATPWNKARMNVAGPLNNFMLSVVVFMIVGLFSPGIPNEQSIIGEVVAGDAAATAGLQANDHVVAIDGNSVTTWTDMATIIGQSADKTLTFTVERNQETLQIAIPVKSVQDEQTKQTVGRIGIVKSMKTALTDRLLYGFTQTWQVIVAVLMALVSMVKSGFNLNSFGGPLAMAQATGQAVQYGWLSTLAFMGMISANLGVFNLLPIPALDGGKIILNGIEALRGKPLSQEKEGIITLIGASLLILLMLAVTWNDISRLF